MTTSQEILLALPPVQLRANHSLIGRAAVGTSAGVKHLAIGAPGANGTVHVAVIAADAVVSAN